MELEVKYQMATDNGYDCEIIKTAEEARGFFECAIQRARSPVWVWVCGRQFEEVPRERFEEMRDMFARAAKVVYE